MVNLADGLVHRVAQDLAQALTANTQAVAAWEALTPIARTVQSLVEGKKRPCCWPDCPHRTDKPPSPWQQDSPR